MSITKYKRVLLKLSGEALGRGGGIEPRRLNLVVSELKQLKKIGVAIAVVVGAGNIWRKRTHGQGIGDTTADYIGLLGTVMNGMALQDALRRHNVATLLQSPVANNLPGIKPIDNIVSRGALRRGEVVIFAGGTGQPFFTTDTAAAQRAVQMNAELIIKAGPADGVYSADPRKFSKAKKYKELTLKDALKKNIKVMDKKAFEICVKNSIPIIVCRWQKGVLLKIIKGSHIGTILRP